MVNKFNCLIYNCKKVEAISERSFLLLYLGTIFIYRLVTSLQGLNVYDEGFQLAGFQQILSNPESVQYQFLYYLSFLCGGLWNSYFGDLGIYGLRVLSAMVTTGTFFVIYKFLSPYISRWIILSGTLILLLTGGSSIFNHNTLTAFFNILAGYFLFKAISRNKIIFIIFSGVILGINVYTRIPNVAMIGLIFVLIPFYAYNKNYKPIIKFLSNAVLGFIIGNLVILTLMFMIDHLVIFKEAIFSGVGTDADSSHNIGYILQVYITGDYRKVLTESLKLFFVPFLFLFLNKKDINNKYISYSLIVIGFVIFRIVTGNIFSLNAFVTTILICAIFVYYRINSDIVYLSLIGLLIEYLQPLGGDWGFSNMGNLNILYSFILALGLSYKMIIRLNICSNVKHYLLVLLALFYAFTCIKGIKSTILHERWFGSYPVWTMTYKPNIQHINVYIDEQTGRNLEEITYVLNRYVKKNDYLLNIDGFPMIHYLTHTRPYLYNPLPWCYGASGLHKTIERAENDIKILPVVLLEKSCGTYYCWVNNKFDLEETYKNKNKCNKIYVDFLQKYNYKRIWENENYVILYPLTRIKEIKEKIN